MVQINWGLAQGPNSFDNALARGFELGNVIRQRQEESDRKNALAAYAKSPNEQTFGGLADAAPEYAMRARADMQEQEDRQRKERQEQMGQVRQLLRFAKQDPMQALAAANSMGIDTSAFPQPGTPEFEPWLDQQILIADAFADPNKLTAIQQDVASLNIDPNTPEGRKAVGELVLFKYGKQTTDEYGRPTLTMPQIETPGAPQQAPAAPQGGAAVTFEQYRGAINGLGPQGAAAWAQRNGIAVQVATPAEAQQLPPGTRYVAPDGVMRVID